MQKLQEFQYKALKAYGAGDQEIQELQIYNQNLFQCDRLTSPLEIALESEPHIQVWSQYLATACKIGVFKTLKNILVQLNFPIQEGISHTEGYRAVTLKGAEPQNISEATGLILKQPEKLDLKIHQSFAGAIPVLLPNNREDFVTLVRALTKRNEPISIPTSMGACMISGYNNWERIRRYRQQLSFWNSNAGLLGNIAESTKKVNLIPSKKLYQDRLIILSNGFYSNVAPEALGLSASEWQKLSLTIRLEHECTHYFTRRLFKSMQNNLLDELIADYRGIVAALGYYRADWFLHFLGLESYPRLRKDGRLHNYRGQPPLSDRAFRVVQDLVVNAAQNLESFDRKYARELQLKENQPLMLITLCHLTLEELAFDSNLTRLQQVFAQVKSEFSHV